jgi:hypothetical protein
MSCHTTRIDMFERRCHQRQETAEEAVKVKWRGSRKCSKEEEGEEEDEVEYSGVGIAVWRVVMHVDKMPPCVVVVDRETLLLLLAEDASPRSRTHGSSREVEFGVLFASLASHCPTPRLPLPREQTRPSTYRARMKN